MRKLLIFLFASQVFVFTAYAQEQISSFYSMIEIKTDGTMDVTEVIDYDFPSPRHGIFRQIPLVKTNDEGKDFLMTASDVFVMDENANYYPYSNNSTKKQINLKIGDPDKTVTGTQSYVIGYTVAGALTYFEDFDEIYWNITGNEWEVPISFASTNIKFPFKVDDESLDIYCYIGVYESSDSDCDYYFVDDYTVNITANDELPAYAGMTIAVDFPKGLVSVLEPTPDKMSIWAIVGLVIAGVFVSILYVIWPIKLIIKNFKNSRITEEEKRVVAAWFDPPETKDGRKLTAGEIGLLHDIKPDVRDITADLIQLAQKGYIKIKEIEGGILKKKDYELIKVKEWNTDGVSDVLKYEKKLLDAIFIADTDLFKAVGKALAGDTEPEPTNTVKISELGKRVGFKTSIENAYKDISTQLVKDGILHENITKTREKWMVGIIISAIFFNPLMVIASILGMKSIRKTKLGATAAAETHSLKNFLESQDKQLEFQAKNQMFFEKLLPYAIAFGVEKVWMERFKDIDMAPLEWAEVSDFNAISYAGFVNSFNNSATKAYAASAGMSSSGFSSGGGGGFSGGGGGGGGGGSW